MDTHAQSYPAKQSGLQYERFHRRTSNLLAYPDSSSALRRNYLESEPLSYLHIYGILVHRLQIGHYVKTPHMFAFLPRSLN